MREPSSWLRAWELKAVGNQGSDLSRANKQQALVHVRWGLL